MAPAFVQRRMAAPWAQAEVAPHASSTRIYIVLYPSHSNERVHRLHQVKDKQFRVRGRLDFQRRGAENSRAVTGAQFGAVDVNPPVDNLNPDVSRRIYRLMNSVAGLQRRRIEVDILVYRYRTIAAIAGADQAKPVEFVFFDEAIRTDPCASWFFLADLCDRPLPRCTDGLVLQGCTRPCRLAGRTAFPSSPATGPARSLAET